MMAAVPLVGFARESASEQVEVMQHGTDQAPDTTAGDKKRKEGELRSLSRELERRLGSGTRYVSHVTPEQSLKDYVAAYVQQAEALGKKFPKRDGKPVYGRVALMLTVDKNGHVEKSEEMETSDTFLSTYFQKLLKELPSSPFPRDFPPGTRRLVFPAILNYRGD
jgi:hypothetical protein